jgi:RNA polymerase sigma-70 factor (ECF subfamily)
MFLTYRPRFLHMAERILRNREDAEDAVQNAFISAFRHLRSFEGRSALRTWFTRVVLNAALMILRRRHTSWLEQWPGSNSADALDWTETLPGSQPDPEMIYAKKEIFRQIDAGLGKRMGEADYYIFTTVGHLRRRKEKTPFVSN